MGVARSVDEFVESMLAGQLSTSSKFKVRSESAQVKTRLQRFDSLKKAVKKRSKLLFPLELALPFDPMTGSSELYNNDNKFRLTMSPTSAVLVLKKIAAQNATVKELLMRRANVKAWDLTNLEEVTEEDKSVFRLYLFPRIFTMPVVNIRNERITGNNRFDGSRDYKIKVDRDPITGMLKGDMPYILQANKFLREIAFEEITHLEDCRKAAKEGRPYTVLGNNALAKGKADQFATITDKDWKEVRSHTWKTVFIGDDNPSNSLVIYEIPLENDLSISNPNQYKTITAEEMGKMARMVRQSSKIKEVLDNYKNKTFQKTDKHFDFWEVDMTCPTEATDEGEIGQKTTFAQPSATRLWEEKEIYDNILQAIRGDLDASDDIEERFLASARLSEADKSLEEKIQDTLADTFDLNHPFLTQKVILNNADFITLTFSEDGDELVAKVNLGFSDAQEGSVDADAAQAANKEYNMDRMLEEDDADPESDVEAASLTLDDN